MGVIIFSKVKPFFSREKTRSYILKNDKAKLYFSAVMTNE